MDGGGIVSTAILMSGQARSFGGTKIPEGSKRATQPWARRTFENQCWYLYRHLRDPEFFVSLANDEHAAEVEPLLLSRFPREKVHVEIVDQPTMPEPPIEAMLHSAYCCSSPSQSILRDLWHRQRVYEFWREHHSTVANTFARVRPDSYFQSFRPQLMIEGCCVPYWSSYGGVNDRFAIMDRISAPAYFRAFTDVQHLLDKGCPFHPETLLAGALHLGNVRVNNRLPIHFFTLRRNGDVVPMTLEESVVAYADKAVGV
jgi:hypothetical protein